MARSGRIATIAKVLAGIALALGASGYSLRFLDGPVQVFNGGPLRAGELVDYAQVDWVSLDHLRDLEFEIVSTGRSRLMWFSVYEDRPYLSCGFGCTEGRVKRWPHHVELDPRVVVRVDGIRVKARAERVMPGSEEYEDAYALRDAKFAGTDTARGATERSAHDVIIQVGSGLTGEDEEQTPSNRLYRLVAP